MMPTAPGQPTPPPAHPSKSQQKKRRNNQLKNLLAHNSTLTDNHGPAMDEIGSGTFDPTPLENPPPVWSAPDSSNNTDTEHLKTLEREKSVVVEAIAKRVKALTKKAQRVNGYRFNQRLNDDQKALFATLPVIEGTLKELERMKKIVETLEAGTCRTRAQDRAKLQEEHEQRVSEAAQHAEASLLPRVTSLVSFLALHNLLTHATPTGLSISRPEHNAILSAGDVLLTHPPLSHVQEIVQGFLSSAGSWENIEYARLVEITSQFTAPHTPTPILDPDIAVDPTTLPDTKSTKPLANPKMGPEPETKPKIIATDLGQLPTTTLFGAGYHFMQDCELDTPAEMTESQEWFAVQRTANPEVAAAEVVDKNELVQVDIGETPSVEITVGGEVAEGVMSGGAPLDQADAGEHNVPDLSRLQG